MDDLLKKLSENMSVNEMIELLVENGYDDELEEIDWDDEEVVKKYENNLMQK